jgi:diguanylate cyclase (GGDEF)-like protein
MIGLQLVLFAIGWWSGAHRATRSRAAVQALALFNLGMGLGTALIGLRGLLPYWVAYPLSNLLTLTSFVVLWRGAQALTGKRWSTREQLAVLLVGGGLILWFGQSAQQGQERVACYFLATAWIAARGGWQGFERLLDEGLKAAALGLLAAAWGIAAMFVWRAAAGLGSGVRIELDHSSGTTHTLALVSMMVAFSINMVFAQIIFGRATAELERLARDDGLTGLFNRRAIVAALETEWQRFRRSGQVFSVACIDLDHFKAVNDAFGHAAGDAVLVGVAARLRAQLRPGDHLGRSGGEEFLVVLAGCDRAEALRAAERLRCAIGDAQGLHPAAAQRLTISLGVATAHPADGKAETLLARADDALYRAKRDGRNTVCEAVAPG